MTIKNNIKKVLCLAVLSTAPMAYAEIITSIPPIDDLVRPIVGDVVRVKQLKYEGQSPHDAALRPSQMRALNEAKVIFYVDDAFETFLPKAFAASAQSIERVALASIAQIEHLPRRKQAIWIDLKDAHDGHDEHEAHDGHNDHEGHDGHDERDEHEAHEGHDEHEGHAEHESNVDLHLWLNPQNQLLFVKAITNKLSALYPQHQSHFVENAKKLSDRIRRVEALNQERLKSIKDQPFLVSHDALQYFEHYYGLNGVGALSLHDDIPLSAKKLIQVMKVVETQNIGCLIQIGRSSESFSKMLRSEHPQMKQVTVDVLAFSKTGGHLTLLDYIGSKFVQCLSE